jgi:hypothetical protein
VNFLHEAKPFRLAETKDGGDVVSIRFRAERVALGGDLPVERFDGGAFSFELKISRGTRTEVVQETGGTIVANRIKNLELRRSASRPSLEDKVSQTIFRNANWNIIKRCQICGHKFASIHEATLDHVIPWATSEAIGTNSVPECLALGAAFVRRRLKRYRAHNRLT